MVRFTATTRWKHSAAQARSWVLAITVRHVAASSPSTSMMSSWVVGSMAVTGSSSRKSWASAAMARARNTRRRWPPDRACQSAGRAGVRHAHPLRAPSRRDVVLPGAVLGPRSGIAAHHHHSATVTGNAQSTISACGT